MRKKEVYINRSKKKKKNTGLISKEISGQDSKSQIRQR